MDEKRIVLDTVEMISQLMGTLESQAFELEGFSEITMSQMHYLETIGLMVNPTFGELADQLNVTRPSVSAIVKKLIQTGYLEKIQSTQDGRVYTLHLTEKGMRFNELHGEVHQMLAKSITENLNQDEIKILAVLLGKITKKEN